MRMRTKLENGVLSNGQQPQAFVDQGEFEAMKTLSGWEAARYDEYQFRAKIKLTASVVFELSLFDKCSEQRREMALLLPHTFAFSCLLRSFRPLI